MEDFMFERKITAYPLETQAPETWFRGVSQ